MPDLKPHERIIFALDVPNFADAKRLVAALRDEVGVFKVGLELFVSEGPAAVRAVKDAGARCFLDLKLHDIPETTRRSVRAAAALGADFLTVHCAAGTAALTAARDATKGTTTQLLGVGVLTSLDAQDLAGIGLSGPPSDAMVRLGQLARAAGVDGMISSPEEVSALRKALGASATLVVPGIRPSGAASGDQKRAATPAEAIKAGADYLVVGRPIRDAADPIAAARTIAGEIAGASGR